MKSQIELPLTLQLPMPFRANVYPSPHSGKGVTIYGSGYFTLTFEQTENPNIAGVRIKDILVKLSPTYIPFDIDRDGWLESIELNGLTLNAESFDLEESNGEYDLENGLITLKLVFLLKLNGLFSANNDLDLSPIRFTVMEHGWMDLHTGHFETHSNPFTVLEGPFAGLTILGDQRWPPPEQSDGTQDFSEQARLVSFGIRFLNVASTLVYGGVWKCADTPVELQWRSSRCDNVEITPVLGIQPPNGQQIIINDSNITYTARTIGGEGEDRKSVNINVIQDGQIFNEKAWAAKYDKKWGYWVFQMWNDYYDQNIRVSEIRIQWTNQFNSVTYDKWRLDHIATDGSPVAQTELKLNEWVQVAPFPLRGEYRFTPMLPPGVELPINEITRTVYFDLKVTCQ